MQVVAGMSYEFTLNSGRVYSVECGLNSDEACSVPTAIQSEPAASRFVQQRALESMSQVQDANVIVSVTVSIHLM